MVSVYVMRARAAQHCSELSHSKNAYCVMLITQSKELILHVHRMQRVELCTPGLLLTNIPLVPAQRLTHQTGACQWQNRNGTALYTTSTGGAISFSTCAACVDGCKNDQYCYLYS